MDPGQVATINTKSGPRDKRTLTIADENQLSIAVTMWGALGSQFDFQRGQVVAIKNAKVSEFQGKSLNCSDENTFFFFEPNHPRTLEL